MIPQPLILVIDDEQPILDIIQESLSDEGFRVKTLSEPEKALSRIGELIPDLILLDIFMPNINGLELLEKIKREYPHQKVIMISGFGTISTAIEAMNKGALSFIEKPLNLDEILEKIAFLKKSKNITDKKEIKEDCNFIGESYLFKELVRSIHCVANLNLPILIYGHHGTGKTSAAKYLHSIKGNDVKTFEVIDCAIPMNLNLIKLNEIKTIYLKNINLLSQEQQKLVLQLVQKIKKSIQIIASSTQQLFKLFQTGKFQGNLFYELNALPIEIPKLDKRRHDIPLLVNHFLNTSNQKNNSQQILSTSAIRLLRNTNWPGNVRQLKDVMCSILSALPEKQVVQAEDIYPFLDERKTLYLEEQSFTQFTSLEEAKNFFEKKFLLYHLKRSNFDLTQVSDKLHLKVPQLRARMQELKISLTS